MFGGERGNPPFTMNAICTERLCEKEGTSFVRIVK